jgi:hypothetical protein
MQLAARKPSEALNYKLRISLKRGADAFFES